MAQPSNLPGRRLCFFGAIGYLRVEELDGYDSQLKRISSLKEHCEKFQNVLLLKRGSGESPFSGGLWAVLAHLLIGWGEECKPILKSIQNTLFKKVFYSMPLEWNEYPLIFEWNVIF